MNTASHDVTQQVFRSLADPIRRDIVTLLAVKPCSVHEVASQFTVSRTAVVKHLKVLESSGLVVTETSGRERINHLDPQGLKAASDWLADFNRFWETKLQSLKMAVEDNYRDESDA